MFPWTFKQKFIENNTKDKVPLMLLILKQCYQLFTALHLQQESLESFEFRKKHPVKFHLKEISNSLPLPARILDHFKCPFLKVPKPRFTTQRHFCFTSDKYRNRHGKTCKGRTEEPFFWFPKVKYTLTFRWKFKGWNQVLNFPNTFAHHFLSLITCNVWMKCKNTM